MKPGIPDWSPRSALIEEIRESFRASYQEQKRTNELLESILKTLREKEVKIAGYLRVQSTGEAFATIYRLEDNSLKTVITDYDKARQWVDEGTKDFRETFPHLENPENRRRLEAALKEIKEKYEDRRP